MRYITRSRVQTTSFDTRKTPLQLALARSGRRRPEGKRIVLLRRLPLQRPRPAALALFVAGGDDGCLDHAGQCTVLLILSRWRGKNRTRKRIGRLLDFAHHGSRAVPEIVRAVILPMRLDHIIRLRNIPIAAKLLARQLTRVRGADRLHRQKHVGLLVGLEGVADALREGQAGGRDGEGVALEVFAAAAVEVAGVGAADGGAG